MPTSPPRRTEDAIADTVPTAVTAVAGAAAVRTDVTHSPPRAATSSPDRDASLLDQRRTNRRRADRKARVEVRRTSRGLGPNRAVALLDVCEDGIGVCLSVPFQPGEKVAVVLIAGAGRTIRSGGEVRWCTANGDGTYRAGVTLTRGLGAGRKSRATK